MNKLAFFKLDIKRKLKLVPTLIIGTVALSIIIGIAVFFAAKMIYAKNGTPNKKQVVFCSQDNSKLTKSIVKTLSKSESVNLVSEVVEMDYEDALSNIDDPQRITTIVVPAQFLKNMINGINLPIKIYYSSVQSLYTLVISELSKAAELSLKSAQASIFVLDDYYTSQGYEDKVDEDLEEMNIIYLTRAFTRDGFFRRVEVTSTGNLSMLNYYLASAIMLVILMLGCIFILKEKENSTIFSLKLRQNNIGSITRILSNVFSTFLVIFIFLLITLTGFFIADLIFSLSFKMNYLNIILNCFVAALCSSCLITCISNIISGKYSSVLLYFILIFASGFTSGAFIPSMLLPEALENISVYLPTTYIQNIIGSMFSGQIFGSDIGKLMIFNLIFLIIAFCFMEIHHYLLRHYGKRGDF